MIRDQAALDAAVGDLVERDPSIARQIEAHGFPLLWTRPAGFSTLVLLILEQQVSLASAAATYRKILARLGEMTPDRVLATSVEDLRADGVSRQKDRYLRVLATALGDGTLDLASLDGLDDLAARRHLTALPGIGPWTADAYLLACLGRPDVWPVGDRALQVAAAEALDLPDVPDQAELERIGERWRPLRAVAAQVLWHGYLERRGRTSAIGDDLL